MSPLSVHMNYLYFGSVGQQYTTMIFVRLPPVTLLASHITVLCLTHCGLVMPYGDMDLCQDYELTTNTPHFA